VDQDHFVTQFENITERKRAEAALRKSEEEYRLLFQNNPNPMWVFDPESLAFLAVNDAAVQHYGYSRDEFLSMTIKDIRPPEDIPLLERQVSNWTPGISMPKPWRHRKKDGTIIDVEVTGHWTEFGGKRARIILANDITQRKRAEEQLEHQLDRLSALRAIDATISTSFDLRLTLDVVLDKVLSELHVDAAAVLLLNPQLHALEYFTSKGFRTNVSQRTPIRVSEDNAGRVAMERRVLYIPNLRETPSGANSFANENFVTYYGAPLIAKGQVKGVLEIYQRTPFSGDDEWLDFMEALAGQAAIAIDSAQLFVDLQRSNFDLELAYDATIEGWSRALDLRDKETEGHTLRVVDLTLEMARVMGLPENEMVHIRRGALLHDIGKMGVPDAILLKPDKLTEEEWTIMRRHPTYAYEMLLPIVYLRPALDIPYGHHEKWDGTGYPRKLRGAQIPLAARIFALVDVWDALSHDRPYRPAWETARVMEYIQAETGKHFDPQVVDVFFNLVSQGKIRLDERGK
jgi:PAS domain S-box-containing protein/putative nucleotidyltransferase with HDIG domain